ncbi:MAG: hypothetical protein AB7T06_44275 [Kofleriaceae bacterium]
MALGRFAPLVLLLSGCDLITDSFVTNEFSGDEYPIAVDTSSGALRIGLRLSGVADRPAILDVLAPLTWVDPGPDIEPSVETLSLTLLGLDTGGSATVPRAVLDQKQVVLNHPCDRDVETCVVGPAASPTDYRAIIGADSLAGDAVRLRLGDDQIFVLADIGGDEVHRTRACDGVFPSPYRGGGTILIGGTELGFGGRRIAIPTCLGDNPSPTISQAYRGADALFVLSTGIGPSIMGESAYRRWVDAHPPCDPATDPACPPLRPVLESLPLAIVNLPNGPVEGRLGAIENLALVASSSATPRAACRQVYASHFMVQRNCNTADDCPCEDPQDAFCGAPAIVHLAPPSGLEILVVPDANPTLQALRTELRPNQAEVDGILGTSALETVEIDVDYPHNRLLARCSAEGCITRPQLTDSSDRPQMRGCLKNTPPGPVF